MAYTETVETSAESIFQANYRARVLLNRFIGQASESDGDEGVLVSGMVALRDAITAADEVIGGALADYYLVRFDALREIEDERDDRYGNV